MLSELGLTHYYVAQATSSTHSDSSTSTSQMFPLYAGANTPSMFTPSVYMCGTGIELGTLNMIGKHTTMELHPSPLLSFRSEIGSH